jgi:hypothetical protein
MNSLALKKAGVKKQKESATKNHSVEPVVTHWAISPPVH